jgi:hypothetical protein
MAYSGKSYVGHAAIRVRDIEWPTFDYAWFERS